MKTASAKPQIYIWLPSKPEEPVLSSSISAGVLRKGFEFQVFSDTMYGSLYAIVPFRSAVGLPPGSSGPAETFGQTIIFLLFIIFLSNTRKLCCLFPGLPAADRHLAGLTRRATCGGATVERRVLPVCRHLHGQRGV